MKSTEKHRANVSKPRIDKGLNKYAGKVLFPEKVEKVAQLLKSVPPPKLT